MAGAQLTPGNTAPPSSSNSTYADHIGHAHDFVNSEDTHAQKPVQPNDAPKGIGMEPIGVTPTTRTGLSRVEDVPPVPGAVWKSERDILCGQSPLLFLITYNLPLSSRFIRPRCRIQGPDGLRFRFDCRSRRRPAPQYTSDVQRARLYPTIDRSQDRPQAKDHLRLCRSRASRRDHARYRTPW